MSATLPGGGSATYRYDPFGRRFSKTVNGITTIYQHDDLGRDFAEYDAGSNQALRYHIYSGPDETAPVATTGPTGDASQLTYLYKDRLGSVVGLGNAGGAEIARTVYLPFGYAPNGGPTGTAFGYAGYRYDAETGLYYVRARYYDPRLGRFVQPDPIGQNGGMNLYAYTGNDPLNLTDPSGLCTSSISGCASAVYRLLSSATNYAYNNPGTTLGLGLAGAGAVVCAVAEPCGLIAGGATTVGGAVAAGATLTTEGALLLGGTGLVLMNQNQQTGDQQALKDIVNQATNGGRKPLSVQDANTVLDWAGEYNYPGARAGAGDVAQPSNWTGAGGQPHIHLPGAGRNGHIPVDPGVLPRE